MIEAPTCMSMTMQHWTGFQVSLVSCPTQSANRIEEVYLQRNANRRDAAARAKHTKERSRGAVRESRPGHRVTILTRAIQSTANRAAFHNLRGISDIISCLFHNPRGMSDIISCLFHNPRGISDIIYSLFRCIRVRHVDVAIVASKGVVVGYVDAGDVFGAHGRIRSLRRKVISPVEHQHKCVSAREVAVSAFIVPRVNAIHR
jgi:hypothetical protein